MGNILSSRSKPKWGIGLSIFANVWFGVGGLYWIHLKNINPLHIVSARVFTQLFFIGIVLFIFLKKVQLPLTNEKK
jgi:EamA domain-containing membrane protein RarD